MSNFDIKVINWQVAESKLKTANRTLGDLIAPISNLLPPNRKYLYQMNFNFSESIIEDGQMIALKKNKEGEYLNQAKVNFTPDGFSGNGQLDFERFVEDCEQNTDHPLSVVTSNCIEIYSTKQSSLLTVGEYSFPLNIIQQGDLFGVWGSINSIFKLYERDYYPWNAVAGKACIIPLFPEPRYKKSSAHYRKEFSGIFGEQKNTKEGIISIANDLLGSAKFTEIIIIPKVYYTEFPEEDSKIKNAKSQLREYLFKTAWEQTKSIRDMPWNDRKLVENFETGFNSVIDIKAHVFAFNFAKHLLSVVDGKSFILKPVSEEDGLLFEVFKKLVKDFAAHSDRYGSLLDYTTPVFLLYEKLNKRNPKGIELTHSPSINIELPHVRLDVMSNIMQAFMDRDKMKEILKSKGFEVSLKYFKEKGAGHAYNINDYIESELISLYKNVLPDNHFGKLGTEKMKVKLPKSPSLFNSFIQIERTNW